MSLKKLSADVKERLDRIIANSDDFYAYKTPTDFRIEHRRVELFPTGSEPPKRQLKESYGQFLRFTSAVQSPYPENNLMNARWFPKVSRVASMSLKGTHSSYLRQRE